jgi:hypothetical protein
LKALVKNSVESLMVNVPKPPMVTVFEVDAGAQSANPPKQNTMSEVSVVSVNVIVLSEKTVLPNVPPALVLIVKVIGDATTAGRPANNAAHRIFIFIC